MSHLDAMIPQRIIIYPRDVQNIVGVGARAAQRMIRKIKLELDKPENGLVTVQEFCAYLGIDEEDVKPFIVD